MDRFIALYRGINVTGKNPVKMESLRAMHERLGHRAVQSYIQSGNIIFEASGSAESIERKTAAEFTGKFGFSANVLIIEAKRWGAIVKGNPYSKFAAKDPRTVHLGICQGKPDTTALAVLLAKTGGSEAFVAGKGIIYLHAPDGYGTSKFAAGMERACGVPMTVRNWRTAEAIWTMAATATALQQGPRPFKTAPNRRHV